MDPNEQQSLLDDLHAEARRLAAQIGVSEEMLPRRNPSPLGTWISLAWYERNDGDDPDGWYLSLMRNEDGVDWALAEVLAEHPDYLLYVLFDEITAKLAKAEAAKNGAADPRLTWFAAQEELLGRLNNDLRARAAHRHAQALKAEARIPSRP